jgi:hypothetical protein
MYTDECCRVGAGVATDCPLLTVAATAVVPQSEAKFTLFWVGRIGWMIDIMSAAEARWCCGMRLRKPACRHCCSIINVYACFGEEEKILENGSLCSLTYIYIKNVVSKHFEIVFHYKRVRKRLLPQYISLLNITSRCPYPRTDREIGGLDSSDIFCNSDYKHFLA